MLAEIEVVIAAKGDQPAARTLDGHAIEPLGIGQHAMQVVAVERCKLAGRKVVE